MDSKDPKKRKAELVRRRFKKASELCQEVFDRVEVNRNLYKGYLQIDDTYEWDYSLVDQQIFPLIRNYIARSNPSNTKVRLEARKKEDFEKRQVNQDFVNWEISELDLTTLLVRAFYSNFLTGKAYFKSGWKYETALEIVNGKHTYVMRPIVNRADLKFVKFNNIIIPDRNIPDLHEQPYIFELVQLVVGDMIKENEAYEEMVEQEPEDEKSDGKEKPKKTYWNKAFIEKLRTGAVKPGALDYEAEFVTDEDLKDDTAFHAFKFPAVCMHTKEGELFYLPLNGEDDEIINDETENPFWHGHYPFLDMTAFPEDDEFFSMSVVDATGDLQIASTEVLNQTLTNIRSINNNMWISGSDAASTPDYMFKQRPSGVIRVVGDPNQIQPVRPVDSTRSMLEVGRELNSKFEKAGGISSLYSSGSGSQEINQTARGAQIIDKNIETNVQMILDLFGEQVLKGLGDHFQELNAQFVTEDQSFAVTGKKNVRELMEIGPERISANFDVYTYSESMVKQTPASRQASLQNLITVINTQVIPSGVQVDLVPLVQNLIDSYPEMENVDDVVTSLDEKGQRDCMLLAREQMPEVKVRDDHESLMQIAAIWFEDNQATLSDESKEMFDKYIEKHLRFIQAKKEISAMQQPVLPPNPALGGGLPTGAGVGGGTLPENTGTGQVNPYNLGLIAGA